MKKILFILLAGLSLNGLAQTEETLLKHYEAYYNQMRSQGDVRGVINALTHLNVLQPSTERRDTLAYVYSNNNQHMQALNTVGIELNPEDSDLALQVKAVSLKSLNQPRRALEQFQLMYERAPNPYIAYEIADLKIQIGDSPGALSNIEYGIANSKDDMKYAFYERQQPYEVPLKAAFIHLKGLAQYNIDKSNIDQAIASFDEALKMAPNFNLASLSKQALESRKGAQQTDGKQE
jgi:tetratricopeptide (TPR) repeat protein